MGKLSQKIYKDIDQYFIREDIQKAYNLINKSCIKISFQKSRADVYHIVSGIVTDRVPYQVKITIKEKEETISGQCDCIHWKGRKTCYHVAALVLYYFDSFWDQDTGNIQVKSRIDLFKNSHIDQSNIVTADEFGTILKTGESFQNKNSSKVFEENRYQLLDESVVNLHPVLDWSGKLIVNIKVNGEISFSHLQDNGIVREEVNLFSDSMLFDWQSGKTYRPSEAMSKSIRLFMLMKSMNIDEVLNIFAKGILSEEILFQVERQEITFEKDNFATPTLTWNDLLSYDKNISFNISYRKDSERCKLPFIFKLFCSENNIVEFKTKVLNTNFIKKLLESILNNKRNYYYNIISNSNKNLVSFYLHILFEEEFFLAFNRETFNVDLYEMKKVKALLSSIYDIFGINIFKKTKYYSSAGYFEVELNKLSFQEHIYTFTQKMTEMKIPSIFKKNSIQFLSGKINFNKSTNSNSVGYELVMDKGLLKAIRESDVKNNCLVFDNNFIVVNEDENRLIHFLKRYLDDQDVQVDYDSGTLKLNLHKNRMMELFFIGKFYKDFKLDSEDWDLYEKLHNVDQIRDFESPQAIKTKLRDYQKTGFRWLRYLYEVGFGACLADDMGLGKTIQTITFLQSIYTGKEKILIVCPVSILSNWSAEFEKFSDLKSEIYYGGERKLSDDCNIIITSYGILRKEINTTFNKIDFNVFIMDEIQNLKNMKSLGSMAARMIKAKFRIGLTGTPVENNILEFYNILDLCLPGIWPRYFSNYGQLEDFDKRYIKELIRPFVLRRTKTQVLNDLPEKEDNYIYLEFSPEERQNYDSYLKEIQSKILSSNNQNRYIEFLKGIMQLRKLCLWQMHKARSTKIEYLFESLRQIMASGHKALIFSQFTSFLDQIQEVVIEKNWKFSRIDGKMSYKKRKKEINHFDQGDTDVFLISLKAGGLGLNLTAASYVFIMDPWWNPTLEEQAIDRAYRIGQKNKVCVFRPIVKNTIEEKVLLLQDEKRKLFNELFSDERLEYFQGNLTVKDFERLILDSN